MHLFYLYQKNLRYLHSLLYIPQVLSRDVLVLHVHSLASRRHFTLFIMTPLPIPSPSRSSPAKSLVRHSPSSTPSVDACLVPFPLSPGSAYKQVFTHGTQPERPTSWIGNSRNCSHNVISGSTLDIGVGSGMEQSIEEPFYKCTLCFRPLPPRTKPYTLPGSCGRSAAMKNEGTGRVFCEECWMWIYDLSICWTCGEVVGRSEERVGFGWCWWHWGCLGCLICKVRAVTLFIYSCFLTCYEC